MAHLRLLIVGFAIVATVLIGYVVIPRWVPRLEGRVVEELNGRPVAGAEVFASYEIYFLWRPREFDVRWTTTDTAGSFVIPGHFSPWSPRGVIRWDLRPYFRILHREFGFFEPDFSDENYPGNRNLRFEVARSTASLRYFESPRFYDRMCATSTDASCARVCEVAYGSVERCRKGGFSRD